MDYSVTKGAIVSFTRWLSEALVEKGIRVNAVAPDPIWKPLIPSTMPTEKVERFGRSDIAVYGPPSACITGLREVADAGAELMQLHLLFDDTEQMERLATEVIPKLS